MRIWQSVLVMLSVAVLLGFSSQLYARTPGCVTCDPAWDPNLPCAGDNCNDGEGNPDGNTGDSWSDGSGGDGTGSSVDSDTQLAKDDDDDKEKLIGAVVTVGVLMAIIDASQSDEDKLQARQDFLRGKRGMVVPHLNVTEQGHSYGLQYEMRF